MPIATMDLIDPQSVAMQHNGVNAKKPLTILDTFHESADSSIMKAADLLNDPLGQKLDAEMRAEGLICKYASTGATEI